MAVAAVWQALAHGAERECRRCPWLSSAPEKWLECEGDAERCPIVREALHRAAQITRKGED